MNLLANSVSLVKEEVHHMTNNDISHLRSGKTSGDCLNRHKLDIAKIGPRKLPKFGKLWNSPKSFFRNLPLEWLPFLFTKKYRLYYSPWQTNMSKFSGYIFVEITENIPKKCTMFTGKWTFIFSSYCFCLSYLPQDMHVTAISIVLLVLLEDLKITFPRKVLTQRGENVTQTNEVKSSPQVFHDCTIPQTNL